MAISINDYLAEELIFQILSWLPVISLLRGKLVCKSWKSIISNPQFIQAHLTNSHKKQPPFSLLRDSRTSAFKDMYIHTRGENSVMLTLPRFLWGKYLYIRSCNGLVSLAVCELFLAVIYIWNPMTRLFKLLPQPKLQQINFDSGFANNIGFGFDSVSNDYKILSIVSGRFSSHDDSVIVAELYSTNADSWKGIQVPQTMQGFKCTLYSKCINVGSGVLYFEGLNQILSFDLHDEVFGLYEFPKGERMSNLLDFDGSIAVILKSGGRRSVLSLWMLDDVCGNLTWTKKFNIKPDLKKDRVLLYLGDEQFFTEDYDVGYMFYDNRKKGNKKFPLLAPVGDCMSVVQFTESIVSLEGFERLE